jgi:hypothetical protein
MGKRFCVDDDHMLGAGVQVSALNPMWSRSAPPAVAPTPRALCAPFHGGALHTFTFPRFTHAQQTGPPRAPMGYYGLRSLNGPRNLHGLCTLAQYVFIIT